MSHCNCKKIALVLSCVLTLFAHADVAEDRAAFSEYFYKKFPDTPKNDFINGVYSIDAPSREQWVEIEERVDLNQSPHFVRQPPLQIDPHTLVTQGQLMIGWYLSHMIQK